ncbi:MAG: AbrB/MazE/SpoVT family DNA-binding domain-containing protein [Bradymonadia bacterium]
MPTATVTSKGQITLPKEIRDTLSVQPGDRVMFWRNPQGQVVVEAETRSLMSLKGVLKGKRKGVTVEEMNEAIARGAADANS